MNNLRVFVSRYRLIGSVLALALMLTALTLSPPSADAFTCDGQIICGQGCIDWNAKTGCTHCQVCCACGDDYQCNDVQDSTCEYTYN